MRTAGTHFGAVGGQPADFQAFAHAHFRQQLPQQKNALPAEACNFDGVLAEMMRMLDRDTLRAFILGADLQHVDHGALRRHGAR